MVDKFHCTSYDTGSQDKEELRQSMSFNPASYKIVTLTLHFEFIPRVPSIILIPCAVHVHLSSNWNYTIIILLYYSIILIKSENPHTAHTEAKVYTIRETSNSHIATHNCVACIQMYTFKA